MDYLGIRFHSEIYLIIFLVVIWVIPWLILQRINIKFDNASIRVGGLTFIWIITLITHIALIKTPYHFKEFPFVNWQLAVIGFVILAIQLVPAYLLPL
ncbi:MAG: hypothetical protein HWE16_07900 [Gammaproteobacteria bacterium]|nr:hypothetical protein [Gammaproteobacteria bacterium]